MKPNENNLRHGSPRPTPKEPWLGLLLEPNSLEGMDSGWVHALLGVLLRPIFS